MKIVFMGTIDFSVKVLDMVNQNYGVSLVVTKPDTYVGRKHELSYSPVKEYALNHNLKIFQPENIKYDFKEVVDLKPDLVITAAFGQFIPKEVIECARLGCINVHGSLLPKYRGGSPIQTAIINGEKETGITIMYMDLKMDSGDIISQRKINIEDDDTNETLFNKLAILGADLLKETLPLIINGTNKRIKQNEEEVTFAYNIKHEEQFINFNETSLNIYNKIRGLAKEPGALINVGDTIVKIFSSKIVDYVGVEAPGTVLKTNKELLIRTKDGAISILDIQQSGKKQMDIKSYLNGQKLFVQGCIL